MILLGGHGSYLNTGSRSYFYNSVSDKWTDGPHFSVGRTGSHAGLVKYQNGRSAIIIAGGHSTKSSEILNVKHPKPTQLKSSETHVTNRKWIKGPDLPYTIWNGASIQLDDTFLIVGGRHEASYLDIIWKFDVETEAWSFLDQKLKIARNVHTAFLVPDYFC